MTDAQPQQAAAQPSGTPAGGSVEVAVDAATAPVPAGQVRVWVAVFERGFGHEIVRKTAVFINPNDTVDEFLREVYTKLSPLLDYCNHPAALTLAVSGRVMDPSEAIRPLLVQPLLVVEAPTPTFTQRGRQSVGGRIDAVASQLKSMSDQMDGLQRLQKDTQSRLEHLDTLDKKVGIDSHHSVHARLSVMGPPAQINAIVPPRDESGKEIQYPVTWYVIMCSLLASCGGVLFGYDVGIAGGVVAMTSFKLKFFPSIIELEKKAHLSDDRYCVYANPWLQLIVSSLFITAMCAAQAASYLNPRFGRKKVLMLAGLFYIAGTFVLAGAEVLFMLVLGRVLWGCSVGLATATVPMYISEMAPPALRGTFNILFQVAIVLGILCANLINYGLQHTSSGWRYSWGLGGIPAVLMTIGAWILPNTPSSELELGRLGQALTILKRLRGDCKWVDREYNQLVDECKHAAAISQSAAAKWTNLFTRPFRCGLLVVTVIPFLQQFTGINTVMFYAPELYIAAGVNNPLLQTVLGSIVMLLSTFVSLYLADKVGRRPLFIEGGVQMVIALIMMAIMWGADLATHFGSWAVFFTCLFTAGFAWSWGPVSWLVPTEIMPAELRSTGMAICTTVNFAFTAVVGQAALSMLCSMKYGIFLFFAAWIVVACIYVWLFLPETKGVPLEEIMEAISQHWFWSDYTQSSRKQLNDQTQLNTAPSSDRIA